jgi:preprotein translocase subunit SecA
MDRTDGRIYSPEELEEMTIKASKLRLAEEKMAKLRERLVEMKYPPTEKQLDRDPPRVLPNEPCPCGSGRKFKSCHMEKTAAKQWKKDKKL